MTVFPDVSIRHAGELIWKTERKTQKLRQCNGDLRQCTETHMTLTDEHRPGERETTSRFASEAERCRPSGTKRDVFPC